VKYRHAFHAGNFADVHKHVTLVALLRVMRRKEKGFFFCDTHAGRGLYELDAGSSATGAEWRGGIGRLADSQPADATAAAGRSELDDYLSLVTRIRNAHGRARSYPGSPLFAAELLRPQDRGLAIEALAAEAAALRKRLPHDSRLRIEQGDGFEKLRAVLPPGERRALVLIDPPYEESREDFARVAAALEDVLARFETCVVAAWFPIKQAEATARWLQQLSRRIERPLLVSMLRIYPADSRASLNGSGLVIANPPYLFEDRMREWLPVLHRRLGVAADGGIEIRATGGRAPQASRGPGG
jgi:23S rRNA (adenine2030-N6)-methyltransferase